MLHRPELRLTRDAVVDQCEGHQGGGDRDRFVRVYDMSGVDRGDFVLVSAHQPGDLAEQPDPPERNELETEMLPVDPVAVTATQRAGGGDAPGPRLDDRNDVGPDGGRLDPPFGAVDELHSTAASEEYAEGAVPSEPCDRAASGDQFMGREPGPADSAQRDRALDVGRQQRRSVDRTRLRPTERALLRWSIEGRGSSRLTVGVRSDRFGEFIEGCRHEGLRVAAAFDELTAAI